MSEKEKVDFFKFGKFALRLLGFWPKSNFSPLESTLYKIYGILLTSTTLIPFIICSLVDLIFQLQTGEWMETLPKTSITLAMMLGIIKVLVFVYNCKTIQTFMDAFDLEAFEYKKSKYLDSNKILKPYIWLYNAQVTTICFGCIGILAMSNIDTAFSDPIITKSNKIVPVLPFINWLPYDYSESPIYEISFCMINIWFISSAIIVIILDTLCMGLLIHISGQLKILRIAMETLRSRAIEEIKTREKAGKPPEWKINEKIGKMFRKCVAHHQAIISNMKGCEEIFSTVIFLQFFVSCLMLCFPILVITNNNSPISTRMNCLIILACSIWELTIYCYFGNEIIVESNHLSRSIYMSQWYEMEKSMMKNLAIMTLKTQKPMIFKAGGFVPLSLHTFVMVLKASYSYYAFLRNTANK